MVMAAEHLNESLGADWSPTTLDWLLSDHSTAFDGSMSEDLNTPRALTAFEDLLFDKKINAEEKFETLRQMDSVLGLSLSTLTRAGFRSEERRVGKEGVSTCKSR